MTSAYVESVQALTDFKGKLGQFGRETVYLLESVAYEISRIREWLEERQRHWQYQFEYWQENVYAAHRALENCYASRNDDYTPDCSGYEAQLNEACRYLHEAQEELQNVCQWRRRFEEAVSDYERQAFRLVSQLHEDFPKAIGFLDSAIEKLQGYIGELPISALSGSASADIHSTGKKRPVKMATFGFSNSTDYTKTFFEAYPDLQGKVIVHHAVEQQVLARYPGIVKEEEIHSLENLRGIPNDLNSDLHLSKIRKEWNRFYKANPKPTKEQLLEKATDIDQNYGELFNPQKG